MNIRRQEILNGDLANSLMQMGACDATIRKVHTPPKTGDLGGGGGVLVR